MRWVTEHLVFRVYTHFHAKGMRVFCSPQIKQLGDVKPNVVAWGNDKFVAVVPLTTHLCKGESGAWERLEAIARSGLFDEVYVAGDLLLIDCLSGYNHLIQELGVGLMVVDSEGVRVARPSRLTRRDRPLINADSKCDVKFIVALDLLRQGYRVLLDVPVPSSRPLGTRGSIIRVADIYAIAHSERIIVKAKSVVDSRSFADARNWIRSLDQRVYEGFYIAATEWRLDPYRACSMGIGAIRVDTLSWRVEYPCRPSLRGSGEVIVGFVCYEEDIHVSNTYAINYLPPSSSSNWFYYERMPRVEEAIDWVCRSAISVPTAQKIVVVQECRVGKSGLKCKHYYQNC